MPRRIIYNISVLTFFVSLKKDKKKTFSQPKSNKMWYIKPLHVVFKTTCENIDTTCEKMHKKSKKFFHNSHKSKKTIHENCTISAQITAKFFVDFSQKKIHG